MKKNRSVAIALLLAFSVTLITPAASASAFSLSDLTSQTTNSDSSSGSNLLNILLGLLLGNTLGKVFNTNSVDSSAGITSSLGKILGGSSSVQSSSGQKIVDTAQKYMGVPYVWGAETPSGWDCSGFTRYVMNENGISLPRTAAEQFAVGTPVDRNNLQPGDLVFFTTYKPGASHVGFYMGGGKFIHASSVAKQVTISSLDEQYYTDHYIGARRYTK
ncbi:MAG: C40 family peptidase [Pelosinus sp.]|nr:C40 family peptidase [Pelosinus sp.]